jgi:hypothetical protein
LLLKCSVVFLERRFDFLLGIAPHLQKCPQILTRAATKYLQYRIVSFFLPLRGIRIDGLFLAPAPLFPNYVVQIVIFFTRSPALTHDVHLKDI